MNIKLYNNIYYYITNVRYQYYISDIGLESSSRSC